MTDDYWLLTIDYWIARVVKLVDTYVWGAYAERLAGSSPVPGTLRSIERWDMSYELWIGSWQFGICNLWSKEGCQWFNNIKLVDI